MKNVGIDYVGVPGRLTGSAWTPRVSIDWKPSENILVYATASRGYKSGGFDEFAFPSRSYNPEYVWNYEVGLKVSTADRRLSGNLTGFIMDYSNLQQSVLGLDPGEITFRTINAAKAKIKGIEAELEASPIEGLKFNGSVAYLDTRYEGLRTADPLYPELGDPVSPEVNVRDLTGNRLAGAPKWQFNVGGDYKFPVGEWQARLNASYSWNSKTPLDIYNNPGFSQDSVGILSGSASMTDPERQLGGERVQHQSDQRALCHERSPWTAVVAALPGLRASVMSVDTASGSGVVSNASRHAAFHPLGSAAERICIAWRVCAERQALQLLAATATAKGVPFQNQASGSAELETRAR